MKKRLLFVDDEPALLDALRGRLHHQRAAWDMTFVASGEAALAALEQAPFDVIVCDMRMPGMDGAALLATASERWPQTVRIVLSGYASEELTLRLVPVAHQYLSKPCDAAQLENVIERCLQVRQLIADPAVREVAGRIRTLPALPRTYARLRQVMNRDDIDVKEVAAIVGADSVVAAKVLQVVNSAFFRLARPIARIEQAIVYLGFGAIRNLALSAEVFSRWRASRLPRGFDPAKLQAHAHAVAAAAVALAWRTPLQDDAMLAGLLHEIGLLVLAQECPGLVDRAAELAHQRGCPLADAEREVIGATHAELGAYLLGIWGLPFPVVEAVAYHQTPARVTQARFDLLAVLAVAHALACEHAPQPLECTAAAPPALDEDYLRRLQAGLTWDEARARVESARKEYA